MSRTSRKNINTTMPISKIYRTAAYVRLSVAKPNQPHDSIENQKEIIKDYVASRSDLSIQAFYADENVSGISFERKGFQQMLKDITNGKIDCVIVKDLSRFGRNAIEAGFYIQRFFPEKGIRFISILDHFDTLDGITDLSFDKDSGIRIPLMNILNEEFIADIKRKQKSSMDAQIHEGKYVAPRAPYGYMKASNDCHRLIPDPEAAAVVKKIFALANSGVSISEIVRRLNLANIPTPIAYALSKGLDGNYEQGNGAWNSRSVKYILTNRTYASDLRQGQDEIVVENTHEPLVDRDIFLRIQQTCFRQTDTSDKGSKTIITTENPLRGKVICASCGSKMQRRKGSSRAGWYFFSCITNNRKGSGCSTGMYIRESDIMGQVKAEFSKRKLMRGAPLQADLTAFIYDEIKEIIVGQGKQIEIHLQ